jgi:hypothetical protein
METDYSKYMLKTFRALPRDIYHKLDTRQLGRLITRLENSIPLSLIVHTPVKLSSLLKTLW